VTVPNDGGNTALKPTAQQPTYGRASVGDTGPGMGGPPQPAAPGPLAPFPNIDWGSLVGMLTGDTTSQLRQQAGFQLQRLGVQGQEDNVTKGQLLRQYPLLAKQFGLQNQLYGEEADYAKYREGQEEWRFKGSQAAKGATGAPGTGAGVRDLKRTLSDELTKIGIERKRAGLAYNENRAQVGDALKQLQLQGKIRGIDAAEVKARLQNALDKTGLSNFMSIFDLLQSSGPVAGAQQQLSGVGGLMSYLIDLGGAGPSGQGR
jgi:hypothetical protein